MVIAIMAIVCLKPLVRNIACLLCQYLPYFYVENPAGKSQEQEAGMLLNSVK
jgi:hypothetical protein